MRKIKLLLLVLALAGSLFLLPQASFASGKNFSREKNAAAYDGTKAGWLTTDIIIEGSIAAGLLIGGVVFALAAKSSSTSSPTTTPSHH